jgi:cysteine-rich repeat protein
MHRSKHKHSVRIQGLAIAVIVIAAGSAVIGSCVFDTRTNFCEQFGIRCKEGEQCATDQPICINIDGCGNHRLDPGEVCDDGNTMDGDGCSADCRSDETCGNGITDSEANPSEECDHGKLNGTDNDTCDAHCHIRSLVCGNGIIDQDKGEQCDPGPTDSADCNSSSAGPLACKASKCGDGYTNMAAGEMCDSGMNRPDTADCNGMLCTAPACGDNYINAMAGEECESNGSDTRICNGKPGGTASCRSAKCGDGYVNPKFIPSGQTTPETCDNAGGGDTMMCNGNNSGKEGPGACQPASCGDNYINTARQEECDNGTTDTPGCNGNSAGAASCKNSKCGDNHVNTAAHETCDNSSGDDTPSCNGSKGGDVACQAAKCGDKYTNTEAGEKCDGGTADTPDCNGTSAPKMPTNLQCQPAKCGDNYVNAAAGETCDNTDGADTSTCNGNKTPTGACQKSVCGDKYTNTKDNETCDNGDADTQTCNGNNAGPASCHAAMCGDHHINQAAGEDCEDDTDCTAPAKCHSCKCE